MMTKFIIEEFENYKVFLYGKRSEGQQTDYGVDIKLPSGRAHLRFCKNWMGDDRCEEVNGKKIFYIFLRSDKYPAFIDLLRNEKPLFFYYEFDGDLFYITTSDEPVGEAE